MRYIALLGLVTICLMACKPPATTAPTPEPQPSSADAQGLGSPKAFLVAMYKTYEADLRTRKPSPLVKGAVDYNPGLVYDPDMVALMDDYDRVSPGPVGPAHLEVDAIDLNPICQCLYWAPFTTTVRIVSQDAKSANAEATFQVPVNGSKPQTVKYQLVRVDGGWRIHDLGSEDYPSLRGLYTKSIEQARNRQ